MFLDRLDFLFQCISGIQLENLHNVFLADPIGTVRSLVLNGRIPPGIVMYNRIGSGQIQACAARAQ